MPSNLITLLIIAALILRWLGRRQLSKYALGLGLGLYLILGFGPIAHFLLGQLEYSYNSYQPCDHDECKVDTIVVLTGDGEIKANTPITSYVNSASLYRTVETSRLYLLNPNSRIYISGSLDVAQMMKQILVSLDIPAESIVVDDDAESTYQSAVNLKNRLSDHSFLLVTSAGHMPRAMAVFEAQSMKPTAAPTQFISQRNILAAQYLPTPRHLLYSELAIHEYLALIWYRLSGKA